MKLKKLKKGVAKVKSKYSTLQDVVDKNRQFSMMYSGVEDENNFNILYDMGIRNFLISFYYVQKKRLSTTKYKELGIKFFVDSGAFSFISNIEFQEYSTEQWEEYIESYLKWVEKNKEIIFAFASLDLEYLVGGDKVQEWNEKYFEPFMLRTGIPVCFVHHDDATKLSWEQYCQRYPYVGISWNGIDKQGGDINWGMSKLRIAEKYNSLVHGMAMTNTSLLTKLPFYTVDSTTWLVGLKYGEVNFWTGKKMSRLKKDKWKGVMLNQITAKGFNEEKLLEEDLEEMIKVNVYAFIEAEKYIQERLKSRMYWLKPISTKRSEEDIANLNYPSIEWLNTPRDQRDGLEEYAKEFNISMEIPNEAMNLVVDMTCFMNWDKEEYQEFIEKTYTLEVIKAVHDVYINKIVESDEERVEDLINFYKANLLGEDTTLLYLGTNFDRTVKEREEYISDEEYEYADITEVEVTNTLSKYLPSLTEGEPAPEISDLDDEIFREEGIEPIRDSNGRFIKGQKKVLKPKKLYSKKFPKLSCDMCFNAQVCPDYKAGYVCAYNKMFDRYNTRDIGDVVQAMQGIADLSMQRLQRAMISETMNGGMLDPAVTGAMNQTMGLFTQLQKMYEFGGQEVLKQTKIVRADGSEETTTSLSNPQSGGILEKMFSNLGKSDESEESPPEEKVVDVDVKED